MGIYTYDIMGIYTSIYNNGQSASLQNYEREVDHNVCKV